MANVYLSIGTNIGDKLSNLQSAIDSLKSIMIISKISSVYETEPWGILDQAYFLNICVLGEFDKPVTSLLKAIKKIELDLGRKIERKWGPRLIDIDVLFYNNMVLKITGLELPHREIEKRAFVLVPMVEIAPDFEHPVLKMNMKELLNKLSSDEIVKLNDNLVI